MRVVVDLDDRATGPDPVALLRDDVATLQRDLGDLRTSLGGNFERLGTALEERAEARHGDEKALAREVAAVQQAQFGQRADLGKVAAQVQGIDQRLAQLAEQVAAMPHAATGTAPATAGQPDAGVPAAAAPGSAEVPTPKAEPAAAPAAVVPLAGAPEPGPPEAAPAAKPAQPKGSFLSFSVPATKFQFTEPQDYVLVADLCRVGFDAKSTLHDFTGVTSKVRGQFTADFDDPDGAFRGSVACEAKTLVTGVDGRDAALREHLDTEHHPEITFTIGRFEPVEVDAGQLTCAGTIAGQMTIRGKTRDVRMPVKISVDPSKRVVIEGQMPLLLSDYGVPVPSQMGGAIKMQDEVQVWVALRARVQAGGRK
ncbi:MAG: YceI family protein [Planctomycetes bacterium]|nr:YceI family protein [Planctomycetota bacterium]